MPRSPRDPTPLPILRRSADREEGIAAFEADLEKAAERFATDPVTGKLAAINAVILFLDDASFDGEFPQQWIAPFRAIRDDIANSSRKPGEHGRQIWEVRAKIAAALDVLINQDWNEEQAARAVARVVAKHRVTVATGADPEKPAWQSIAELRTRLLRHKPEATKSGARTKAVVLFDWYRQSWLHLDVLELLDRHLAGQT